MLSAISMLVLSSIAEHPYFCLVAWIYGLSLGGYKYSLKMLSLERIRGKHFTKAWGKFLIYLCTSNEIFKYKFWCRSSIYAFSYKFLNRNPKCHTFTQKSCVTLN